MVPSYYARDPFLAIHHLLQHRWLDAPAELASRACEGWQLAAIAAIALLWLERRDPRRAIVTFAIVAAALAASGGLVQELKELFATPRPLAVYGPSQVRVLLEPLLMYGFPSGHSSAVATFASFIALAYGRRASWVWALALAGGLSRIYVGAHWTVDVLAGWTLGVLLGAAAYALWVRVVPSGHLAVSAEPRRRGSGGREASPGDNGP